MVSIEINGRQRIFPLGRGELTNRRNAAPLLDQLGVDDGGAALWHLTCGFLAPHLGLIFRVADALWELKALDGDEIDALVYDPAQGR